MYNNTDDSNQNSDELERTNTRGDTWSNLIFRKFIKVKIILKARSWMNGWVVSTNEEVWKSRNVTLSLRGLSCDYINWSFRIDIDVDVDIDIDR